MIRRSRPPPNIDLLAPWQRDQGARCGCRGTDEFCPCQNVEDIDRRPAAPAAAAGAKSRSWPYAVTPPDNQATPGRFNVRKPTGVVVFSQGVDALTAREACAALNEDWDLYQPATKKGPKP